MKTLSVTYEKPIEAGTAAPARFRLRVWHLLFGSLLVSLMGWGALFLLIDWAAVALHWIKP
jgi:hypothetical protein